LSDRKNAFDNDEGIIVDGLKNDVILESDDESHHGRSRAKFTFMRPTLLPELAALHPGG
jgi:hypothetical protein